MKNTLHPVLLFNLALTAVSLVFVVFFETNANAAPPAMVQEASGVLRFESKLYLIGDDDPGAYYSLSIPETPGAFIHIRPENLSRVFWPAATLAIDLESIERLADGRLVILSEQLAALVCEAGVVAQYPGPLVKFGERGVEGLAVREVQGGVSRVAVLWEGGYPGSRHMGHEVRPHMGGRALSPVVWVHDLDSGAQDVRIGRRNTIRSFALDVPLPSGREPEAQRFRSPDLVWHKLGSEAREEWGFIAILSSMNDTSPRKFAHHWLQRFDAQGNRVGEPYDLDERLPKAWHGLNWEGLDWFEEGKSLILMYEHDPEGELIVPIIELPRSWRAN
ncbi:MAG: hypothetical protein HKN21_08000 [Candidatus Eisenbacteria bacterium]|uniref:Phytase-like domain-containing protein n=1 Tax=Eiseniibacteriota bacterium TaxID=2212470 RepID=A0A7Y2E938_UNCEI|nr:hypothetical protein [Candidatus Eisenbacteria bacterium]